MPLITLTSPLRRLVLTSHVTFSVGWLGAVAAYLALAITGLTSSDAEMMRAAYLSMATIAWIVIVPCSIAALASGLVQSLTTEWGLFRHYWVLAKFLLTVAAVTVLLLHMPTVRRMAGIAAASGGFGADVGALQIQLVIHAGGGSVVLLTATALSVYKPWGRIRRSPSAYQGPSRDSGR
jgi:hypothetical protein